jgi:hypothetical protein
VAERTHIYLFRDISCVLVCCRFSSIIKKGEACKVRVLHACLPLQSDGERWENCCTMMLLLILIKFHFSISRLL